MINDNSFSFKNPEDRGNYARGLRELFDRNNLNYWWVSASAKKAEIFIQPREYKEYLWESLPTISRISLQINGGGKLSFGVSGYDPFKIANTKGKFEEKGYKYKRHLDRGVRVGRWWLTKHLDNLESIIGEFKDIEPLLFEKN